MEIRASAGDLAFFTEEFKELFSEDTEFAPEPERSLEDEVGRIMLEKLEEMAEIRLEDCTDGCDYANICSIMNEIAKTLLNS